MVIILKIFEWYDKEFKFYEVVNSFWEVGIRKKFLKFIIVREIYILGMWFYIVIMNLKRLKF